VVSRENKGGGDFRPETLFSDSQPLDQTSISLEILSLEVIEKPPPLAYQLEEPPAGMVVLDMDLEMFREVINALAQQGNLHLRRAGIFVMEFELPNDFLSLLLSNPHASSVLLLSFVFNFLAHQLDIVKHPASFGLFPETPFMI